jgi:hypothetical protein
VIILLNNFNNLIFIMETHCVFVAVGTEFLNIVHVGFVLQLVNSHINFDSTSLVRLLQTNISLILKAHSFWISTKDCPQ